MAKKDNKSEEEKGIDAVKNQLVESYQKGVIEDQDKLANNRGIHTYNNQKN
ncbi:hypothetical protein GCM10028778_24870 [Barrientosiimonas marina]|uniref:DUF4025 domain-containing protein n=1 Tax=Lentibacillus kimchii TaxID=1542911 RepID=A0ABW2UT62_9BACI